MKVVIDIILLYHHYHQNYKDIDCMKSEHHRHIKLYKSMECSYHEIVTLSKLEIQIMKNDPK